MTTPPRSLPSFQHDERYSELAAGWALHALEPDEEARFVEHLRDCSRCQADVAEFVDVLGEVARELPAAEPPARLGQRIRAAVRADLTAGEAAPSASRVVDQPPTGRRAPEAPPAPEPPATEPSAPEERPVEPPEPTAGPPGGPPAGPPVGPTRIPPAEPGGTVTPFPSRRLRSALLAAAAAVVVLVMGVVTAVSVDNARDAERRADVVTAQRDEAREVADRRAEVLAQAGIPGTRLVVLRGDEGAGAVIGYAVIRGRQVEFISDGLRANDAARTTYVLWDIPRGGDPRPLDAFDATGAPVEPVATAPLGGAPDAVAAIAVSLEPGRAMPTAPTAVVGLGTVPS